MNRIRVDNVEEAVRVADGLKRSGKKYWFRGQRKDWPVQSSFVRLEPDSREDALEKLARFEHWLKRTPGLEELAGNADATIAVAQHYGIPTNFVDFTTRPEIAAYFASEGAAPTSSDDLVCIVCLDIDDLRKFWEGFGGSNRPPEFLTLAVPDLWRLEAQRGHFLFCPYANFEHIYDFDRILFPNTQTFKGVGPADVYPKRKSHLEILLDQFFMNEQMLEFERSHKLEGTQIFFESPKDGCDPEVFPNGIPEHPSWMDDALDSWITLRPEKLDEAQSSVNFRIRLPHGAELSSLANGVTHHVERDLFSLSGIRSKMVGWELDLNEYPGLPDDLSSRVSSKLERLWDGLRRSPHSDHDISIGIGLCVALAIALRGDFRNPDSRHWSGAAEACLRDPVQIEFGAEDGSYSRAYVSGSSLARALRTDLLDHASDKWRDQLKGNVRGILQAAFNLRKTFDLQKLTPLFAQEIAPYQVLARGTSAVFYSPARLSSLGLP